MIGPVGLGHSWANKYKPNRPILIHLIHFIYSCNPPTRLNPPNSVFIGLDCPSWVGQWFFV